MTRLIALAGSLVVAGTVLGAHGGNEHVRGVITAVSAQSVTVQLPDKSTKTLSISAKTEFETSGKPAHLADVKIGDRVVIDVPEHGNNALSIKVGSGRKK